MIDSVASALSNIHGMEARGVDFSDQTLVAWHGYSANGDSAGLALRDAGYATVMTEITDWMSPYILTDAYKAGISAFDLAGGFGVTNPDPVGDPVGAYLDSFINYTNPALLQAGVDWKANGVAVQHPGRHATGGDTTFQHATAERCGAYDRERSGRQSVDRHECRRRVPYRLDQREPDQRR